MTTQTTPAGPREHSHRADGADPADRATPRHHQPAEQTHAPQSAKSARSPSASPAVALRRSADAGEEIGRLLGPDARHAGLTGVLHRLNHRAEEADVPGRMVDWGLAWDEADQTSRRWVPAGLTTSADASREESAAGRHLLIASWVSGDLGGENHGTRISVLDPRALRYRHVLLVLPQVSWGQMGMKPLPLSGAGLAWCGSTLYVAGGRRGLYAARLDDILEVRPTRATFGYRFVLPVRFRYDAHSAHPHGGIDHAFLSVDRTTRIPGLLVGESGPRRGGSRLARYDVDARTDHLGEVGRNRPPSGLVDAGLGHMRGAVSVHGRQYVTTGRGRSLAALHVGTPGGFRSVRKALPAGSADLSYWPSTDRLWSLAQPAGRRTVFSIDRAAVDRAVSR